MNDIHTVSNKAELLSALSKADGGDTILLASGNYGTVELDNFDFSSMVTITSADGDLGAKFDDLTIVDSTNIRFDGVHVDAPTNGGTAVLHIENGKYIEVINSEINGKADNVFPIAGPSFGIYASDSSSNIVIENNYVHDVQNGMAFFGTRNLELVGNRVENIGADGFKFSAVNTALIENNIGPSYVYPADGTHSDFMQFQGGSSSNLVIRGNVFLPQNQETTQGIFVAGQGGHSNVLIEQNIIYTAMASGVYVSSSSSGVVVRYNTLINHLDDEQSTTRVNAPGATVENNIITRKTGGIDGTNVEMQHLDSGGDFYYTDLFAGLKGSGGIAIEDLTPVEGSLAESKGAYLRLAELLGEDTDTTPPPDVDPVEPDPEPDPVDEEPDPVEEPADEEPSVPSDDISGAIYAFRDTLTFTHETDVIQLAPSDDLKIDAATIALTFNANTISGSHGIVSKDASGYEGGGNHFVSYIRNDTLYVRFQDGDADAEFKVGKIKAGTDYDLVMSFGNGEVAVWLDGKLVGEQAFDTSWVTNNEYFQIGANGWSSDTGADDFKNVFDGGISDFVIVEGVATPSQIESILSGVADDQEQPDDPVQEEPSDPVDDPVVVPPADEPDEPDPVEEPDEVEEPSEPADKDTEVVFSKMGETTFSNTLKETIVVEHQDTFEIEQGTIAFTFESDNPNKFDGIFSKDASNYDGGGNHFSAWLKDGRLNVRFQGEDSDATFVVKNIKKGEEYDLMAFFDGDEVGLYLNDELIGTQELEFDFTANEQQMQIGALGWASEDGGDAITKAFDGTISDVIIFDEVITPSDYDFF